MLFQKKSSLANKYRPKTLDSLVGQDHVKAYFKNAISNNLMHHAYLFSGSSGTGKTTVARIVAAAVNNSSGPSVSPDMSKDSLSLKIINGMCNDVREIDAASNRGIDDIRSLRAEIKYAPFECRTRFVIIDEAHGLTGQAVEAALKMMEEPPPHTCFILCTTEQHKLKETITNRCIDFYFKPVSSELISENIKKVANLEGFEIDSLSCSVISEKSDGCVRKSLQLLEKIIVCKNDKIISSNDIKTLLGFVDDDVFVDLFSNIIKKDAGASISSAIDLANSGLPYEDIISGIAKIIRHIILAKTCQNVSDIVKVNDKTKFLIKQILPKINVETLVEMVVYIKDARDEIGKGVFPALAFEALIIKSIISYHKYHASKEKK